MPRNDVLPEFVLSCTFTVVVSSPASPDAQLLQEILAVVKAIRADLHTFSQKATARRGSTE